MSKKSCGKQACCEVKEPISTDFGQIFAIIPAAGKGSRFGEPKVDAVYNDKTFIKHILDTLSHTPVGGVRVIRDIETTDMLESVKHGINCARKDGWLALGWLIWPVDHPLVKAETIQLLIESFWQYPDRIVNPVYNEKKGHPIIIPDTLDLSDNHTVQGLRSIIAHADFERYEVIVSDPNVIRNVNYSEDLLYSV